MLRKGVQRKCENSKVKKKTERHSHRSITSSGSLFKEEGGPVRSALVGNVVDARLTVGRFSTMLRHSDKRTDGRAALLTAWVAGRYAAVLVGARIVT